MANYERTSAMLSIGEVARLFGVQVSTVRRWSSQGIIKAHRISSHGDRRFRREDVAVFFLEKAMRRYAKGNRQEK